ncbi:uncharacterized protein LOC116734382 [Xiphophorus hellerii]|uniref:uncharacterized protein LOC116734382 n=1 Tax=Xiphophorus hellerii TaxID=8084 RepID=UPI0013B36FD5|nr:uncharacterized protein LOC116734382 [Xiphophorus hellerii]XP_032441628.1 uncharacterized protein LOC116734382 [Xiphophorus hellerii]
MTELGWIKTFLFLVLKLQVTAVIVNTASVLKRAGDDAVLSCQNVVEGQQNCNGTTWLLGGSKSTELLALVTFGQIEGETRTRTSITPNCSLIIKNITAEDDGQYECQQYKSEGSKYLPHPSVIDLSVITMTKHVENQTVTLSCSVMKYGSCKHKVKWLFSHQEMEKCKVKPSEKECSATAICLESNSDNSSSMDQLFQCEVTGASKNVQLFSFSQHSSGATPATQKPTTTENGNTMKTTTGSTPYIGVGVALVVMVIIATVVIRWRAKRNETRRDENAVDADDDVSYASIRHPKTSSGEVLVHGDLDSVTYSTVRSHSSSAAASNDPNSLYSLINYN